VSFLIVLLHQKYETYGCFRLEVGLLNNTYSPTSLSCSVSEILPIVRAEIQYFHMIFHHH